MKQQMALRTINWNSTFWGGGDIKVCEIVSEANKATLMSELARKLEHAGFGVKKTEDQMMFKTINIRMSCKFKSEHFGTKLELKSKPNWYEPYWAYGAAIGSWLLIAFNVLARTVPEGLNAIPFGIFFVFAIYCSTFKRGFSQRDLSRFNAILNDTLNECER